MIGLHFACYLLFEVREEEESELLHSEDFCSSIGYDNMGDQIHELFEHMKKPANPGFYSAWVTGDINCGTHDTQDGPDHYEDIEPTNIETAPATRHEMDMLKSMLPALEWPFAVVTPLTTKETFFIISEKDYQQHQHQHDINALLENDPEFVAETNGKMYTPEQLRLFASAKLRGLKVNLKAGFISIP